MNPWKSFDAAIRVIMVTYQNKFGHWHLSSISKWPNCGSSSAADSASGTPSGSQKCQRRRLPVAGQWVNASSTRSGMIIFMNSSISSKWQCQTASARRKEDVAALQDLRFTYLGRTSSSACQGRALCYLRCQEEIAVQCHLTRRFHR